MNPALTYLFVMQLKNRAKLACGELRQPGRLIGVAALVSLIVFLIRHREHEIFAWLMKPSLLTTLLLVMTAAALVRGLMRRGMAFEPADVEFLFTGPFSERQLIGYRLLSPYLNGIIGAFIFLALFGVHLQHPWLGFVGVILFQIVCFHLTAATTLYAGAISDERYERLYSLAMKVLAVLAFMWIYVVTPLHDATWLRGLLQQGFAAEVVRLMFYPLTSMTGAGANEVLGQFPVANGLVTGTWGSLPYQVLMLAGLAWAVTASLALVHRFKERFVESSIMTTARVTEAQQRIRAGGSQAAATNEGQVSRNLPRRRVFEGAGAVFWKNLVVASRSRRQLGLGILGVVFSVLLSLLSLGKEGGEMIGLMLSLNCVGFLTFMLQPVFRFDLRRDAVHLVELRARPFSSWAFVLAEIMAPTVIIFVFQCVGLLAVSAVWWKFIIHQPSMILFKMGMLNVMFYLTAGMVVNGLWNINYLIAARAGTSPRRASGSSVVGNLTMAFLTCFHIVPGMLLFQRLQNKHYSVEMSAVAAMAVQIGLAAVVVGVLTMLYRWLEFTGEAK